MISKSNYNCNVKYSNRKYETQNNSCKITGNNIGNNYESYSRQNKKSVWDNIIILLLYRLDSFVYKFTHKRYYRTFIIRRAVLTMALAICIPIILSMIVFPKQATAVDSSEKQIVYEYFMNIEIQPGDSLWDYAEKYAKDKDYKKYIKEVKEINHIYSNKITAGDTIILPYYSCIYY